MATNKQLQQCHSLPSSMLDHTIVCPRRMFIFGRSGLTKTFYWPLRALAPHPERITIPRCLVHCMSILIVSMYS